MEATKEQFEDRFRTQKRELEAKCDEEYQRLVEQEKQLRFQTTSTVFDEEKELEAQKQKFKQEQEAEFEKVK